MKKKCILKNAFFSHSGMHFDANTCMFGASWFCLLIDVARLRIVTPMPQSPLYAFQFGLGTLTQPSMASYGVPLGLTVWPVGQKEPLFDSVRVVMNVL